jgi:hypothetical protein
MDDRAENQTGQQPITSFCDIQRLLLGSLAHVVFMRV